jgi:hypothetical protein
MSALISLNPMQTSVASNLFSTNSTGYTQGDAQDDPAVKFYLAGGVYSASATAPIWGGVPIQEVIPGLSGTPGSDVLGSTINQATDQTGAASTGIVVFNQAYQGITTPQSNAPLFTPGMSVNFYRYGSGARIPLPCDASVVSLDGSSVAETVYWDYTNNILTATQPVSGQAALPVKILRISASGNKTVSYNGTSNTANWITTQAVALVLI